MKIAFFFFNNPSLYPPVALLFVARCLTNLPFLVELLRWWWCAWCCKSIPWSDEASRWGISKAALISPSWEWKCPFSVLLLLLLTSSLSVLPLLRQWLERLCSFMSACCCCCCCFGGHRRWLLLSLPSTAIVAIRLESSTGSGFFLSLSFEMTTTLLLSAHRLTDFMPCRRNRREWIFMCK